MWLAINCKCFPLRSVILSVVVLRMAIGLYASTPTVACNRIPLLYHRSQAGIYYLSLILWPLDDPVQPHRQFLVRICLLFFVNVLIPFIAMDYYLGLNEKFLSHLHLCFRLLCGFDVGSLRANFFIF